MSVVTPSSRRDGTAMSRTSSEHSPGGPGWGLASGSSRRPPPLVRTNREPDVMSCKIIVRENSQGSPLGTTFFAEMSELAVATGSVNLGQGFPDTDGPGEIARDAADAIRPTRPISTRTGGRHSRAEKRDRLPHQPAVITTWRRSRMAQGSSRRRARRSRRRSSPW